MNSRERIMAAVDHKPIDGVPFTYDATKEAEAASLRAFSSMRCRLIRGRGFEIGWLS